MGQILLVTLREGIEMFLIVAIAAAYLRKTGRAALLPAVAWGTATAVLASVVLGVWLAEVAVSAEWERPPSVPHPRPRPSILVYLPEAAEGKQRPIGRRVEA